MSDEKSIDNRTLVISNFRNLGPFCGGRGKEYNDDKEFLKINRSLDRDALGGLVILVGVNNSGKSNVLDALDRYQSKRFTDSDYTDFSLAGKVEPYIGMNVANGIYDIPGLKPKGYTYWGEWQDVLMIFLLEEESYLAALDSGLIKPETSYSVYAQEAFYEVNRMENTSARSRDFSLLKHIISKRSDVEIRNITIDGVGKTIVVPNSDYPTNKPHKIYENGGIAIYYPPMIISSKNPFYYHELDWNATVQLTPRMKKMDLADDSTRLVGIMGTIEKNLHIQPLAADVITNDSFEPRYGYNLSNTVYRYVRERIHNSDLVCKPDAPNSFFKKLLATVNYDVDTLTYAYGDDGNRRFSLERKLNDELVKIADELNDLLNIKEKKYSLGIRLESDRMQFMVYYGDNVPLNLDRQSQGFTWLFELYFNLMKSGSFRPGDMILIDEFGDSLGFSTVQELTKKLREYGLRNGITFVLATQNPMAIDISHLDEVRLVVPHSNGSSKIVNQFDRFGEIGDHDAVGPVINGLMVSRNFMRRENRRTVFVEGAMDYFYLNSFADQFRSEGMQIDLDFIPMNGLGAREDDPVALLDEIRAIEHSPMILVDSDGKGRQIIKTASKYSDVKVIGIGERLEGKKEIEDLFSKSDAEKLMVKEKSFDRGASISHTFPKIYGDLEEETKQNFKNLIEYIMDA